MQWLVSMFLNPPLTCRTVKATENNAYVMFIEWPSNAELAALHNVFAALIGKVITTDDLIITVEHSTYLTMLAAVLDAMFTDPDHVSMPLVAGMSQGPSIKP